MSRRVLDLGGDNWWLGQAPAKAHPEKATWDELERVMEWLPATVPGNVRADLVRAGRLPDPFVGTQSEAAQWVDEHCWWLIRDFSFAALPGDRVHLALRGVDYVWDLFLNGHCLGRREGMFSSQIYDITDTLQAENRLAVRVVGSKWLPANRSSLWLRFLNLAESKAGKIARRFPQRRDTLKCQMSFGWDFAPPLRNMGIWDDVYAVTTGDLFIRDVVTRSHVSGGAAHVTIDIELDAITVENALVRCTLSGATFDAEPIVVERPVTMMTGTSRQTVALSLVQNQETFSGTARWSS